MLANNCYYVGMFTEKASCMKTFSYKFYLRAFFIDSYEEIQINLWT